jgi:tetratricopeptide (TPR) repeat protein
MQTQPRSKCRAKSIKWAASLLGLISLASATGACAPLKSSDPLSIMAMEAVELPAGAALNATPGLSAEERLHLATDLLQHGEAQRARVELKTYLVEVSDSKAALYLLSQIETPIDSLFPADSFTVKLGKKETLSSLARTYLGDELGFYGLARFNKIEIPADVREGEALRIPKTPEALAARKIRAARTNPQARALPSRPGAAASPPEVSSAPTAGATLPPGNFDDPWSAITEDLDAGHYDAAIRSAESSEFSPNYTQAPLLAAAYFANAKAIRASNPKQAAARALRAGELYLEMAEKPQEAMEALLFSVGLNPRDGQAQMLLVSAKTKCVEIYYRNGLVALRRQDLDAAIASWDKVLAIDPDHKNAQLNRAQAVELKRNLQKLR